MKKLIWVLLIVFTISYGETIAQPIISISGPTATCSAPTIANYVGNTNIQGSYNWVVTPSAGVVISAPNASATSISFPYSTVTYTVSYMVSTTFGNSITAIPVVVYETPTVSFSGNTSFCSGSSTNLQASATILGASSTLSYMWSPSTGLNTTNGPFVSASPTIPTTYTVVATLGNCSSSSTITVTPVNNPTLSCTIQNNPACAGQTVVVNVVGASTYTFANGIQNGVPFIPTSNPTPILVTGANAQGCTDTLLTDIYINQPPTFFTSTSDPQLCSGMSAVISVTGTATTYSLNGVQMTMGSGGPSISVSPTITTTYTIVGSNGNGCVTTNTFVQNVNTCIGIEEYSSSTPLIQLYPNPSDGVVNIVSSKNETVGIYNEVGQMIRTIDLKENERMEINGLAPGMYLIQGKETKLKLVIIR